jgi:hypothetical protein
MKAISTSIIIILAIYQLNAQNDYVGYFEAKYQNQADYFDSVSFATFEKVETNQQILQEGYLIIGFIDEPVDNDNVPIIYRIDNNYNIIDMNLVNGDFGSEKSIYAKDIIQTDDGFAICGEVIGPWDIPCKRGFIWTIDNQLNHVSFTIYHNTLSLEAIEKTDNNNYIVVGKSLSDKINNVNYNELPIIALLENSPPHNFLDNFVYTDLTSKTGCFTDIEKVNSNYSVVGEVNSVYNPGTLCYESFIVFSSLSIDIDPGTQNEYFSYNEFHNIGINRHDLYDPKISIYDNTNFYISGTSLRKNNTCTINWNGLFVLKIQDIQNNFPYNLNTFSYNIKHLEDAYSDPNIIITPNDISTNGSNESIVVTGDYKNLNLSNNPTFSFILKTNDFFNNSIFEYFPQTLSHHDEILLLPNDKIISFGTEVVSKHTKILTITGNITTTNTCANTRILSSLNTYYDFPSYDTYQHNDKLIIIPCENYDIEIELNDYCGFIPNLNRKAKTNNEKNFSEIENNLYIKNNKLFTDIADAYYWRLYSINGQIISEGKAMNSGIDTKDLSTGIYFLLIPELNITKKFFIE